jgi:hypothetical protein
MNRISKKFCSECGASQRPNSKFCAECGTNVSSEEGYGEPELDIGIEVSKPMAGPKLTLPAGLAWSSLVFLFGFAVWALGISIGRSFGWVDYFSLVASYAAGVLLIGAVLYFVKTRIRGVLKPILIGSAVWGLVSLVAFALIVWYAVSASLTSTTNTVEDPTGDFESCVTFSEAFHSKVETLPTSGNVVAWSDEEVGAMGRWLASQVEGADAALGKYPSPELEQQLIYAREAFRELFKALVYQDFQSFVTGFGPATDFAQDLANSCDSMKP